MTARILFITSEDHVYLPCFFDEFFRSEGGRYKTAVATVPLPKGIGFVFKRLSTFPDFFFPLIVLQAWRRLFPAGGTGLKGVCLRHGAEHYALQRVDDGALAALIGRFKPDFLVSTGCPFILPKELVENVPYAAWNFHGGAIPRYRGAMTPLWALAEGETPVWTWHEMTARVDCGAVLSERALPVEAGESFHRYSQRALRAAAGQFSEMVCAPPVGRRIPENAPRRYCDWPGSRQAAAMRKQGIALWIGRQL